jgi:glycosyltransferase involved in cell wall biosynthesis
MSAPRRILLVEANEDGTTGGSHVALVDLVRHLDRKQFAPVALFYEQNEVLPQLAGFEFHVWDAIRRHELQFHGPVGAVQQLRGMLPAVLRRAAFLRRERIDLVHMNNAPALGFEDWLPAARLVGVPCVAHARGEFWLTRRWIGRTLMRRFDRVLPVSHCMADLARAAGIAPERVVTVHDGIDRDALRRRATREAKDVRAALDLPRDAVVAVQVAHLRRWKGHDLVLDGLARLDPAVRERLRVLFVGAAPAGDAAWGDTLKAKAEALGLDECVQFLGARADVPDLLAAADLLLHASIVPEPFGLVLVEAMTFGKPVLAARLGGPVEILTPESGATFEPRSADSLATELARLVGDAALRQRLGEAAAVRAADFDIAHTVRRVEAVYRGRLR